ncbi:MAG: hypothetical protein A3E87_08285 [Gammaproteobacteria bacterium RIFCSPHIGHO2_12_FULL_35_23]|nr:MAG: hypothetical protein A3E87_08285 [Gammaproteobacteria bacterium RIFCSPHIGHO2_12_FULL_35_23]
MGFKGFGGYLAVLGYCLITAYYTLAIHNTTQQTSPYILALIIFFICLVFFTGINFSKLKNIFKKSKQDIPNLIGINLTTMVNWIATLWSLKYIIPSFFIAIFMSFIPIFTFIIRFFTKRTLNKKEFILICILFFLMTFFIYIHHPGTNINHFNNLGVVLCLIATIAGAFYLTMSEKFQKNTQLTTSQLLSVRFYLLIVVTAIMIPIWISPTSLVSQLKQIDYSYLIVLALLTTVLPLYLIQRGIYSLGSAKVSYIIPATIIFTYLLELVFGMIIFSWVKVSALILITLLIVSLNKVGHH